MAEDVAALDLLPALHGDGAGLEVRVQQVNPPGDHQRDVVAHGLDDRRDGRSWGRDVVSGCGVPELGYED